MKIDQIIQQQAPNWEKLEVLVNEQQKEVRQDATKLLELAHLYRITGASTSYLRTRLPRIFGLVALSNLLARASLIIFTSAHVRTKLSANTIIKQVFKDVRSVKRELYIITTLEILGFLGGFVWAKQDLYYATNYFGISQLSRHGVFFGFGFVGRIGLSALIIFHNILLAWMFSFLGIIVGLPAMLGAMVNTVVLGVLIVYAANQNDLIDSLRLLVPHGFLELSAFTIACALGLKVGWSVFGAKELSRKEILKELTPVAARISVLVGFMLVASGIVEGVITTYDLNLFTALLLGLVLFAVFWTAVIFVGRD